MHVYPAILTDSIDLLTTQLELAQSSDEIETVQIDIIDGWFVDNCTVTPADLPGLEFGELTIDLHLMTEEPLDFVYEARDWKAELPVRAVIAQVERLSSQNDFLREVRGHNWKSGLSLNLFTPIDAIEEESWELVDCIQVMGIEAGFQGQTFHSTALETIRDVAKKIATLDHPVELLVDGGVTLGLVSTLRGLNVDGIAVGSALWQAEDFTLAVADFLEAE